MTAEPIPADRAPAAKRTPSPEVAAALALLSEAADELRRLAAAMEQQLPCEHVPEYPAAGPTTTAEAHQFLSVAYEMLGYTCTYSRTPCDCRAGTWLEDAFPHRAAEDWIRMYWVAVRCRRDATALDHMRRLLRELREWVDWCL